MDPDKILDDPTKYGRRGQTWAPEFVGYMKYIVTHPAYEGMPDALNDEGKIQWEAPSNRSSGRYQFTHSRRREWWKSKASEVGIDPSTDQWISRTAKTIHPTGEKPCKRCGTVMTLAYVYPQANLIKRFRKVYGKDFDVSELEPIGSVIQRLDDEIGHEALVSIPVLFKTKGARPPEFNDFDELLVWLNETYVPSEPSMLSPGAMSNAPDRFDGFHSFNRCCRGSADTGRHMANLRSYTTDRRVFEFWSEGDWIAADRLMGLVRTQLRNADCADGGDGPPTADHIGPLSLGFCHRPEFRLLSNAANSAKNNRMTLEDVTDLNHRERSGERIASWYAQPLWECRKDDIDTEEKALRLSKMLRDNQRIAMQILCTLYESQYLAFLVYLLDLKYAERNVDFINLRSVGYVTTYDCIEYAERNTKYAVEQKARRLRIGFESLRSYLEKDNRHGYLVTDDLITDCVRELTQYLATCDNPLQSLESRIVSVLRPENGVTMEKSLRDLAADIPTGVFDEFETGKEILISGMRVIAQEVNTMWDSDRYVRDGSLH